VVDQLRKYPKLLHKYLHALFVKDPHVGSAYHELQVELYAEYEPSKLLPFLRQSNHYPLKMVRIAAGRKVRTRRQTLTQCSITRMWWAAGAQAYDICKERNLVAEMVFILGRMGNNKEALNLIISRLNDVQQVRRRARADRWTNDVVLIIIPHGGSLRAAARPSILPRSRTTRSSGRTLLAIR